MRLIYLILLGVGGAFLVRNFVFEGIYIASDSMSPTLSVGTHILVRKFLWDSYKPNRGDIIMFDSPMDRGRGLVKRVIAIEGDTIELRQKKVFLNGEPLSEPYAFFLNPREMYMGDTLASVAVPPGYLFVMGDNRDVSGDSRDWKNASGEHQPFLPASAVQAVVRP